MCTNRVQISVIVGTIHCNLIHFFSCCSPPLLFFPNSLVSKQRLLNSTAYPTATISQFPIKQVSTVKCLDIYIDENLTWECHVNELSKKIASGINTIKRIRYSVPYKTLLSIYNPLVQPHLDCCTRHNFFILRS